MCRYVDGSNLKRTLPWALTLLYKVNVIYKFVNIFLRQLLEDTCVPVLYATVALRQWHVAELHSFTLNSVRLLTSFYVFKDYSPVFVIERLNENAIPMCRESWLPGRLFLVSYASLARADAWQAEEAVTLPSTPTHPSAWNPKPRIASSACSPL